MEVAFLHVEYKVAVELSKKDTLDRRQVVLGEKKLTIDYLALVLPVTNSDATIRANRMEGFEQSVLSFEAFEGKSGPTDC